ncbi:unnamed protein product [Caenorhabditis sp. 36 PRJEB53466]|nr:unnamed protein product [Caenorhabditis sp. 36 PRJEB53466]
MNTSGILQLVAERNAMKVWILGVLVILMPLLVPADDINEESYEFDANTNITLRIDISKIVFNAIKQNCDIEMSIQTEAPVDYQICNNEGAIFGSMQPITEEIMLFQDAWHVFFLLNFQHGRARRFHETMEFPVQKSNTKTLVVIHHFPEKWKETIYSYPVSLTKELEMGLSESRIRLETNSSGGTKLTFAKCNLQTVNFITPSFGPNLDKDTSLYIRLLGHLTCPADQTKSFQMVVVSSSEPETVVPLSFVTYDPFHTFLIHYTKSVLFLVVCCATLFSIICVLVPMIPESG